MKRSRVVAVLFVLCSSVCMAQAPANLRAIAAPFLQPGAAIVQMEAHSSASGQIERPKPAIFKTSLSGEQPEIVFAQSIQLSDGGEKVVTLQLLRAYAGVYRSVFAKSYYDRFIEGEGSGTSGLQEVTLSGQKKALLVITSSGASLGGSVELFQWQDGLGLVNLLPSGPGGAHYFNVSEKKACASSLITVKVQGGQTARRRMYWYGGMMSRRWRSSRGKVLRKRAERSKLLTLRQALMRASNLTLACILFSGGIAVAQTGSEFPPGPQKALIEGRVLYADGMPVRDAVVDMRIFAAFEGILPEPARTNEKGEYSLVYPAWGEGFVFASKPSEGYPNSTITLFDRRDAPSVRLVDLEPGVHVKDVSLILDNPLPGVLFRVRDADSGQALPNAGFDLHWSDDPQTLLTETISRDGLVTQLLPQRAIDITITAPGYEDWHWHNAGTDKPLQPPGDLFKTVTASMKRIPDPPPQ